MTRYAPLLELEVGHTFFSGGLCRVMDITPDSPSRALLQRAGLVLRGGAGRMQVLYDAEALETLELFSSDLADPFHLDFRLRARDPGFWSYTQGAPTPGTILAFDSRSATHDPQDGTLRLSKEEVVSGQDRVPLAADLVTGLLGAREQVTPPVALLRVHLSNEAGGFFVPPAGGVWRYRVRFAARETYWRYLLLGRLAESGAVVTDPDGVAQFEFVGEETLPGDRRASSFRSTTRLPLEEFSSRRFQLRRNGGKGAANGPILIKRLPVATASASRRETIAGERVLVSDILVNG